MEAMFALVVIVKSGGVECLLPFYGTNRIRSAPNGRVVTEKAILMELD